MLDHIIFEKFQAISQIPRCSGNEAAIAAYLKGWADGLGFAHRSDEAGNLVVYVPGNTGKHLAPTIILQSHMDMVCEKTPESTHDFANDPLDLYVDGDWLRARGTSLGSDNGIGMAYAMALAEEDLPHPPLELLFTVDEETGLSGALELSPDLLTGTIMFNMDAEEEETLIIGCASGRSREITGTFAAVSVKEGHQVFKLSITNLLGGHSGMEIYKQNANANKLIFGFLNKICCGTGLQLLRYHGGSAMNAIPRDGKALFAVKADYEEEMRALLKEYTDEMRKAYPQEEIDFKLRKMSADYEALSPDDTLTLLDLILLMPHGVQRVEPLLPNQVETSCNLGPVSLEDGRFSALVFVRSSNDYQGYLLAKQCGTLGKRLGFTVKVRETDTGAWQPKWDAPLLTHCAEIYKKVFGREPKIEVIHAGLECGVIMGKYPNIDAIALGPDAFGAHSPSECLSIASAKRIYDYLKAILASYA